MVRALLLMLACARALIPPEGLALPPEGHGHVEYLRPAPQKIEVAPGVYLFVSKPYGDVGLDGNSVVVIGNDAVLVFDTNGTPASAANVLAEIRKITGKPVRSVVNSHWHWDHWYGTEVYTAAFPGVKAIASIPAK